MNYSCEEDKLEFEPGTLASLARTLPIRIKKELLLHQATVSLCYTVLNPDSRTGFGNGLVDDEPVLKVIQSSGERES